MNNKIQSTGRFRHYRYLVAVTLVVLALTVIGLWPSVGMEQYASFTRPDGRYQVLVMRKKSLLAVMPGQASDAPGVVRLYNQRGELLRETDVAMVQLVERVEWEPKHLSIKLIAEWDLPD